MTLNEKEVSPGRSTAVSTMIETNDNSNMAVWVSDGHRGRQERSKAQKLIRRGPQLHLAGRPVRLNPQDSRSLLTTNLASVRCSLPDSINQRHNFVALTDIPSRSSLPTTFVTSFGLLQYFSRISPAELSSVVHDLFNRVKQRAQLPGLLWLFLTHQALQKHSLRVSVLFAPRLCRELLRVSAEWQHWPPTSINPGCQPE